jgi:predicted nucleotidyltransferase component of viral defense system
MLHREAVLPSTLELLKGIMAKSDLSGFHLAGGTSLALQIGHRVSVDLDFFGNRPFEALEILDELQEFAPVSVMSQSKNILVLNVQEVKVDFVNYRYPLISPILEEDGIRLFSPPDIGAMKLTAIAGRGRKRDFFDLYFLLRQYSLPEIMKFYLQKFNDGSEFMVVRSLTYFEDADQDEDVILLKERVTWEQVKKVISNAVRKHYG